MRAFTVCVDYADYLSVTLPYNLHHFEQVIVITSPHDRTTVDLVLSYPADKVRLYTTDLFYRDGAIFNKWRSLEAAFDSFGREGWICLLDADTVWPKEAPLDLVVGNLYSPLRNMGPETNLIPPEDVWGRYREHRNVGEWAGYSQIFHASDPVLGSPPWYEIDWTHAGGGDSMFQLKWPKDRKLRPSWRALHLGPAGTNWCGRASRYLDGSEPEQAGRRLDDLKRLAGRVARGTRRRETGDPFSGEKIDIQT